MPQLVIGGVSVKVLEWSQLEDEQGDGDWRHPAWSTRVLLANDAESAALRTAMSATTPRAYRRAINGNLTGGPTTVCSGDRLGGTVNAGIEIGEQDTVVLRHAPLVYYYTLSLTLRGT